MTRRPNRAVRAVLKAPSRLYDLHAGHLLGRRFLRLTHRGRKSGRVYRTVLEVVGAIPETREVVVVAGLGPGSDWYRNIQAAPALAVEIGRDRFVPAHRILEPGEAAEVLGGYERRNRLAAPVVRAVLSRLVGWRYDGTDAARLRLATQLPFVAFRPLRAGRGAVARPGAAPGAEPGGEPGAEPRGEDRLRLTVREVGEAARVIEVQGDLDIHGAARVLAEVPRYLTAGSRTVLDADGIDFLDSGGLHALIVLARIARTRGVRLSLSNPTPAVLQLIMRTGADEVIDVRTDVEDALES